MKLIFALIFSLIFSEIFSQIDTSHYIKVCFLYGSRPKVKYRYVEPRYFGGIHSGHVTIQVDDIDYGFHPTKKPVHLFPRKKHDRCEYMDTVLNGKNRHTSDDKTATFIIPVTEKQYIHIKQILTEYVITTPYDYAVFGMHCTGAARDVLGQVGIFKKKKHFLIIMTTFYPKALRKKMFRIAKENNFIIIKTEGKQTRKWERD